MPSHAVGLSAPDRWRVNPSGRDLTQETWIKSPRG